jgi:uracil-DNA glycosylase
MAQGTRRLARDLRASLEWQRLLGVDEVVLAAAENPVARTGAAMQKAGDGDGRAAAGVDPADPSPWLEAATLEALREAIGDCRRCRLCAGRTQIVFGVGNPEARLVFVGEAPGHDEDVKGEPFVGRAGQLLTDIIERGMRLRRSDVYICNVVKCRPPGNRNPEPDEVASCAPFLARQMEILRPEVLVTLGKFAAHALLNTKTPITRLRGSWQEYRGVPVMPTFHPAYLLRNPADKKLVWQDIQEVMLRLGISP